MATENKRRVRPQRRTLASVSVRVEWQDSVTESELEVSPEAGWPVVRELLRQAYEHVLFALDPDVDPGLAATREWAPEDVPVDALADLLGLVGVSVSADEVRRWTGGWRKRAVDWASAVHLSASDNDVEIPPRPAFLPPVLPPLASGALAAYEKANVDREGFVRDELELVDPHLQSDLPARGGQCRAIVVRQKDHAEVREPCGYQLDRDPASDDGVIRLVCPNSLNHLQAHELRVSDIPGLEPTDPGVQHYNASLKEKLAERYFDRFSTPPPENMTMESMRAALRRAEDHPANPTGREYDPRDDSED